MGMLHFITGSNPDNAMCIGKSFGYAMQAAVRIDPNLGDDHIRTLLRDLGFGSAEEIDDLVHRLNTQIGRPWRVLNEDARHKGNEAYSLIASPWIAGRSAEEDLGSSLTDHIFGFEY